VALCSATTGLSFVDVSSPLQPFVYFSIPCSCSRITSSKPTTSESAPPLVYLAGNCSVIVVNVSNVRSPVVVTTLRPPVGCAMASDVSPTGAFVAVLSDYHLLWIADLRGGVGEVVWSSSVACYNGYRVVWSADGSKVFLNDAQVGLMVVGVFDLVLLGQGIAVIAPQLLYTFKTPGQTRAMAISSFQPIGYLVDGMQGLHTFRLGSPVLAAFVVTSSMSAADTLAVDAVIRVGVQSKMSLYLFDRNGNSLTGRILSAKVVTNPAKSFDPLPYFLTINFDSLVAFGVPPKEWSSTTLTLSLSVVTTDGTNLQAAPWASLSVQPSLLLSSIVTTRPWASANSIVISTPSTIVAVTITNSRPAACVFVMEAFGAVAASYVARTGLLNAVGTISDINNMLSALRVAIVDSEAALSASFLVTVDDTVNVPQSTQSGVGAFLVNVPPMLWDNVSLPNMVVQQGSPFELNINTSEYFYDLDDAMMFSASQVAAAGGLLPSWITFGASSTTPGIVTFSGLTSIAVSIRLVLIASDGFHGVNQTFLLSVTNEPPTLVWQPPPSSYRVGLPFSTNVSGVFATQRGKTLVYSAVMNDGTALPTWMAFDKANMALSGISALQSGASTVTNYSYTYRVVLTASDGFSTTSCTVTLTFVNDVPVVTPSVLSVVAKPMTSTIVQIPRYDFVNTNDPTQALTFSALNLAPWVHFDTFTLQLTLTPTSLQNGMNTSLLIVASDGFLSCSLLVLVEVLQNIPPSTHAPNKLATTWYLDTQNAYGPCSDHFINPQNNTLSYTAMSQGGAPLPTWLQFDENLATMTGDPTEEALGIVVVVVTATDLLQAHASILIEVSIERNSLQMFLYVATILGYVGSAVGPLIAAYAYRIFLMNLIKGAKNRLSQADAFDESGVFHMPYSDVGTVQAFYIDDGKDSAVTRRLLSLTSQRSFYLHLLVSQIPLVNNENLPSWMHLDHASHCLFIDDDAISSGHRPVNVVVSDTEGLVHCVVYVNPKEIPTFGCGDAVERTVNHDESLLSEGLLSHHRKHPVNESLDGKRRSRHSISIAVAGTRMNHEIALSDVQMSAM
jgi:hypothetical protein